VRIMEPGDPTRAPIRVFVLEDQEIVRRGVRCLLDAGPGIRVIGEAGTASAALAKIPALHPDVAVLAGAVRTAASGRSLLPPRAASRAITRLRDAASKRDSLARLTPHERTVLELIGQGLTNRQIGERLLIAEKTVKNYVSTLFRKLGLEQRTAAAAYAARAFMAAKAIEPGRDPQPGVQ
jgi:DNA-binding NarL/FixJ family response regulator